MKYYEFQGLVGKMEDKLFKELLKIQPDVVELTQKEYEKYHGIGQPGQPGEKTEDVGQPMVQDTEKPTEPPVQGDRTRKEIIAEILARPGNEFKESELKRKRKDELIDLL